MDVHNLATLFGPNILRKTKGGSEAKDLHGEASDYVEESRDVINVVEKLIEFNNQLFQVRNSLIENQVEIPVKEINVSFFGLLEGKDSV